MESISTRYPFHKLCSFSSGIDREPRLLVAGGHTIFSLSIENGKLTGTWPSRDNDVSDESSSNEASERPLKRRKVENGNLTSMSRRSSEASETSIEIVAEGKVRQKGERRKPKIPDLTLPNISHITVTSNGKYAVIVTVEDKAVRVLKISARGRLRQLTMRSLPKRLCALTLTSDEQTILVADKFGDVYSLPLHPSPDYKPKAVSDNSVVRVFKPSASALTVHTKGNLEALKQQELQKHVPTRKEAPEFEHKLLLGHVSLLTDLVLAEANVEGRKRSFILTSDRDEHIRVSRGIPQTHIVQTYCMGHTEFVSKLCVLPWLPNLLVAGSGEAGLRIFEWQTGKQVRQIKLTEVFRDDIVSVLLASERTIENLAVSGIWPVSFANLHILLVAMEGLPLLFTLRINESTSHPYQTLRFNGNVLDIAVIPDQQIVVSVDNVHEAGSMKTLRPSSDSASASPLQCYRFNSESLAADTAPWTAMATEFDIHPVSKEINPEAQDREQGTADTNSKMKFADKLYSNVGEFVYGLENLRKKRGGMTREDDEEGTAMATPQTEGEAGLELPLES